jgi:hypothetical protein
VGGASVISDVLTFDDTRYRVRINDLVHDELPVLLA